MNKVLRTTRFLNSWELAAHLFADTSRNSVREEQKTFFYEKLARQRKMMKNSRKQYFVCCMSLLLYPE